ncbi:DUF2326 domain-containing protein [Vibrio crassostreae]|uniref:DUF2326 domain-containing protein n=1 Tax=Vibrio crassostreae TaxID=246167 RepID=UPI00104431E7|nr:DUF2326 domain-containing protein [Vibrio crassostreae]TCW02592.1 uncharacterized protein DUF2326 [Vibrio crassostreae]CAK3275577.1 DUF2326 domain-containing protein [Vibrio crassostreae]CAK3579813.1 DUF2326 domain-containing protein [Vibrio crassostreae]CAK3972458.1 DUF2326 domain-containing protein [Vibrio crassostreae]
MLKYIKSTSIHGDIIEFENGLNVILGPDNGFNSIGKSSLLLLIDFVFGGGSFLNSESKVTTHVKNIKIYFGFEFNNELINFSREAEDPQNVYIHNGTEWEKMSLKAYTNMLSTLYCFGAFSPTFRSAVGPFSRIYGRKTNDSMCPLAARPGDAKKNGVTLLLKLFERYEKIAAYDERIKEAEENISNISSAFKTDFATKLNKKELKEHESSAIELQLQIDTIKNGLNDEAVNYDNVLSELNLKHQEEIDNHVRNVNVLKQQSLRLERNLDLSSTVNKRHFDRLKGFFPNVNIDKIEEIDLFHNTISKFLKKDIDREKKLIKNEIGFNENEILKLRDKIRKSSNSEGISSNVSSLLVDELLELHSLVTKIQGQINFNYASNFARDNKKSLISSMEDAIVEHLESIQYKVNSELSSYIKRFYTSDRSIPELVINHGSYNFIHGNDTGSGKTDVNMICFDLSMLRLTYLPFIIHDTIVFKQIQAPTTERIIEEYSKQNKQVFVSLDEITRFSEKTQNLIRKHKVIELSGEKRAFKLDWTLNAVD